MKNIDKKHFWIRLALLIIIPLAIVIFQYHNVAKHTRDLMIFVLSMVLPFIYSVLLFTVYFGIESLVLHLKGKIQKRNSDFRLLLIILIFFILLCLWIFLIKEMIF